MDHSSDKTENMLGGIDFSCGREQSVWKKILPRIQASDKALSLSELDDVAGGVSQSSDKDKNAGVPQKWP